MRRSPRPTNDRVEWLRFRVFVQRNAHEPPRLRHPSASKHLESLAIRPRHSSNWFNFCRLFVVGGWTSIIHGDQPLRQRKLPPLRPRWRHTQVHLLQEFHRYVVVYMRMQHSSHANSGNTSTIVLGLHIKQLRMVPGNGIHGTYAERRQGINGMEYRFQQFSSYWEIETVFHCEFGET